MALSTSNTFRFETKSKILIDAINSEAGIVMVSGPVGSGKSNAMCARTIIDCIRQAPDPESGMRRRRVAVMRATRSRLETSVVQTMKEVIPSRWLGKFRMGTTMMVTVTFKHPSGDGTTCEIEYYLLPLSDNSSNALKNPFDKLLSTNFSAIWCPEATEMPSSIIQVGLARIGRYPSKCANACLLMDFNCTGKSHWIYKLAVETGEDIDVKTGLKNEDGSDLIITTKKAYFAQPPAAICANPDECARGLPPDITINPKADNLENLPDGAVYYARQVQPAFSSADWSKFRSQVLCEWVAYSTSVPVFGRDFVVGVHSKPLIAPSRTGSLVCGFDTSGLHPCLILANMHYDGTLEVFSEDYGEGVPFTRFLAETVLPMTEQYRDFERILFICDPSNPRGSELGLTPLAALRRAGLAAKIAPSNKIDLRIAAVRQLLAKRRLCISEKGCPRLMEAMTGSYMYKQTKLLDGSLAATAEPEKNPASHYADALQYAALYAVAAGERDLLKRRHFRPAVLKRAV